MPSVGSSAAAGAAGEAGRVVVDEHAGAGREVTNFAAVSDAAALNRLDEAAPPALLEQVARRLIARRLRIEWWTNVRFESAFTPELTKLLRESGCVALTGGMEAAHDRLLRLVRKGATLREMILAAGAMADAGILVHVYLMYGLPGQTARWSEMYA